MWLIFCGARGLCRGMFNALRWRRLSSCRRKPSVRFLMFLWLIPLWCHAHPALVLDDPVLLQQIERQGFGFGELVAGSEPADNQRLYRTTPYRSMVDSLSADLQALPQADRRLGTGMRFAHRLFDARWLRSPAARYELVGIVNRLDRAPFSPGSCGETRFIYRLAYRTGDGAAAVYSRLPMTVNAVFLARPGVDGSCQPWAQRWLTLARDLPQQGVSAWGSANLGRGTTFTREHLKSVEVNLQSVRWPSTVRPDMAGHAEYLLRVFRPDGERYTLAALENTPDVSRIAADPALKERLRAWLLAPANRQAVEDGVAQLPEAFLARRATSVALHGTHRLANMPFSQLFSEADFAELSFEQGQHVRSAHGYLRRLNDLTCAGCHQGRSVAGFHFLGADRADTSAVNAIAVAASPHFLRDQPRRRAHLDAVASGELPVTARPLSVRADQGEGDFGSHCGLGDPSFAAWTCRAGLQCQVVSKDDQLSRTGVCLPEQPMAGSACQPATMVHHAHPHRDRLTAQQAQSCGAGAVCEQARVGFPGGMCSRGCTDLAPGETCGTIAILQGFNDCLARQQPFATCLSSNVRPAALKACSATAHCRDDYICARTAAGEGACIPPYFLFQLRVDGHPSP